MPTNSKKSLKKNDSVDLVVDLSTRQGKNIIVPDTNVLIDDPDDAVSEFLKGGNLVVIPWHVITELDDLKGSKDVAYEAQRAIKKIFTLLLPGTNNIIVEQNMLFARTSLNKIKPDHKIVATVNHIIQAKRRDKSIYYGYDKVKLVTNDYGMQIIAREVGVNFGLLVEFYKKSITKLRKEELVLASINVPSEKILKNKDKEEYYVLTAKDRIFENASVIVYSDKSGDWKPYCVAVRKGDILIFLDSHAKVSGIEARHNGHQNWQQICAIHYLTDPDVKCVFLQGGAGTGKTLLALAAGMDEKRRKRFVQIVVSRPTVPLNDEDMGWLPGDIAQKFSPWLLPIFQNVALIKKAENVATGAEGLKNLSDCGIEMQPLAYIRGATFSGAFIIIDEAQNLTRHQIKTIITRAGEGTKIVFTGDLGQIDNPRLNRETSGLTHAIAHMKNSEMVGIVNFAQTIRSKLVEFAEKVL